MTGHLLDHLLLFGRTLRGLGMNVPPGRMSDLATALTHIDLGVREDFYHTTRTVLVHHAEDLALFDQAFALFWRTEPHARGIGKRPLLEGRRRIQVHTPSLASPPAQAPVSDDPIQAIEAVVTYSAIETLRRKDFAALTPDEVETVTRLIGQLNWDPGRRRTRRLLPGRDAGIDLRRTLRQSLRHGGEILHLARQARRTKPRPVVVLADVSGSMERYTRLLLHFLFGLTSGLAQPVETFVFGTRLTRITRALKHKRLDTALREVSVVVNDWAGGTRIGDCLERFNFDWGRRVLSRGPVVMMISDGWDRGDPTRLGREMARLHRSAFRVIWLNPLLGSADYEPLTRGLQAALPHVDDFLPVHNLVSLEDLAQRLRGIK